jgi:transposase
MLRVKGCVIADFCRVQQPLIWIPPSKEERYLRDLCRTLETLKESQRSLSNRLENTRAHDDVRNSLITVIDVYDQEIKNIGQMIKDKVNQSVDLKRRVELLTQIKGIGFLTAITLLVEIPNVSNFENAREYVAFAGLNPRQHSSGASVRGKQRISKIGSQRVRKALFMPALVVKNKNHYFKGFCDRLVAKGKCAKVIIVAVMRKLMHIVFGMLKNNTSFDHKLAFSGDASNN